MKPFDVLDPNSLIRGVHFLEASAGTGKTFAIEHLVARLLLEGEHPLAIDQILVMTFTNAATRELKFRIRSTLEKISHSLSQNIASSRKDYLWALAKKNEEEKKIYLRRVQEALASFDSAQIFTIHGFCHRILSEFAFEAKASFQLPDADSQKYKEEIALAVKDFFRTEVALPTFSTRQLERLLKKYNHNIDRLTQKLSSVLEKGMEIAPSLYFFESYALFQKTIKNLPFQEINAENFLQDFAKLKDCYKKMGNEEVNSQAQMLAGILERKEASLEEFDEFLKEEFFLKLMEENNQKKKAQFPKESSLHYPGLFENLRQSLVSVVENAQDPGQIVLRIAKDCQKRIKELSEKEEKAGPDELLKKMQKSLQNPSFIEKVRKKYKAAIIDEFQDTDPVQWDLFSTLFLSPENKMEAVYLVGDPKQSIYAFRSADLYTYLLAKEKIGRGAFLDTNFRSEPSLVESLNVLFSTKKGQEWMRLPFINQSLPFREVKPAPDAKNQPLQDIRGRVHFFLHEEESGREKRWPTDKIEENLIFPCIANEILSLKKQSQINYGKMAILVKDRYQEQRLSDYLLKAKIPSCGRIKTKLCETKSFYALKDLLEAVIDPSDASKVKKVLAGPFISWEQSLLKKGIENIDVQKALGHFYSLQQRLVKKGFGFFFHEFLLHRWKEKTVLEHLLSCDLSFYADLQMLVDLLIEKERVHAFSLEGMLLFLIDLAKQEGEEDERGRILKEEDGDKVILMTSHASKGLEFEIVFALGIASRHSSQEDWVRIKKEKGDELEPLDLEKDSSLRALKELDAEKMRQLYVALTRAKKRVYIPFPLDCSDKDIPFGQASPLELFFAHRFSQEGQDPYQNIKELKLSQLTTILDELKVSCSLSYSLMSESPVFVKEEEKKEEILILPPLQLDISFKEEWVHSFSSLSTHEESSPKEQIPTQEKNPYSLPLGKETGILLHQILEKIFQNSWLKPSHQKKIENLILRTIQGSHLEGWEDVLFSMVQKTLVHPIENFSLCDLSLNYMQQEMEFLLPVRHFFLKGFIDLVFSINGKYYLIDWKTNWLGESYEKKDLEVAMKENDYYLQAAIYATALKAYVKLFDNRPFEECFGGAIYFFLRGDAIYHFFPDLSLLERIDKPLDLGEKKWE